MDHRTTVTLRTTGPQLRYRPRDQLHYEPRVHSYATDHGTTVTLARTIKLDILMARDKVNTSRCTLTAELSIFTSTAFTVAKYYDNATNTSANQTHRSYSPPDGVTRDKIKMNRRRRRRTTRRRRQTASVADECVARSLNLSTDRDRLRGLKVA